MLGSNPSADSVASTDRQGGMLRHPLSSVFPQRTQHRERRQATNPGGAGAKPLQPTPATKLIPKHGAL
jgi:hypothetical protein